MENENCFVCWDSDPIDILKWVLTLIDEPGNNSGDVKELINEKIFTFTEKKVNNV